MKQLGVPVFDDVNPAAMAASNLYWATVSTLVTSAKIKAATCILDCLFIIPQDISPDFASSNKRGIYAHISGSLCAGATTTSEKGNRGREIAIMEKYPPHCQMIIGLATPLRLQKTSPTKIGIAVEWHMKFHV